MNASLKYISAFLLCTCYVLFSSFSKDMDESRYVDSVTLLEEKIKIANQKFEYNEVIHLTISLALAHADHGDYLHANELLRRAYTMSDKQGNEEGLYLTTNNLGNLYLKAGMYERAADQFFEALDHARELDGDLQRNTVLNNIGILYSEIGDSENALSFFLEALVISKAMDNQEKVANNTINIGSLYQSRGDIDQALVYFEQAEVIYQSLGKVKSLGATKLNLAKVYSEVGNTIKADLYFKESQKLLRKEYDSYLLGHSLIDYSEFLFAQQKFDEGLIHLEEVMTITEKTNDFKSYTRIYSLLEKYYRFENKMDSAYSCRIIRSVYTDSLAENAEIDRIARYKTKSELFQAEEELRIVQEEARLRMFIVGGCIFLLVVISIYTLLWYRERIQKLKKEKELSEVKLEHAAQEQERLQLEFQVKEEINKLNQEKLQNEVDYKSRELASVTMHILSKNEMLTQLKTQLKEISSKEMNIDSKRSVKKMNVEIQRNLRADYDWDNFKLHFEQVHPGFFDKLLEKFPSLNANDLRLCAYVVMDLNSKEISQLFNISPDSVRKRRQRLRTKLSLTVDDNVKLYLSQLSL